MSWLWRGGVCLGPMWRLPLASSNSNSTFESSRVFLDAIWFHFKPGPFLLINKDSPFCLENLVSSKKIISALSFLRSESRLGIITPISPLLPTRWESPAFICALLVEVALIGVEVVFEASPLSTLEPDCEEISSATSIVLDADWREQLTVFMILFNRLSANRASWRLRIVSSSEDMLELSDGAFAASLSVSLVLSSLSIPDLPFSWSFESPDVCW